MQSKLMKYEWKAYLKPMWIIIGIIVLSTILCSIGLSVVPVDFTTDETNVVSMLSVFGSMAFYYIIIIGCGFAVSLLIAIRYYKSMYSDQAYLTHTLPVTKKQLFSSKLITASLFEFFTCLVLVISIFIIIPIFIHSLSTPEEELDMMTELFHNAPFGMNPVAMIALGCFIYFIMLLIGSFSSSIMIFTAITLGQLFTKHRIIGAILCYFGITAVQSMVSMIGYFPFYIKTILSATSGSEPGLGSVIGMYIMPSVLCFIFSIIMLLICYKQLIKNLNLE